MIQLAGEFIDLGKIFGKNETDASHCSGLVKLAPNNADLFIAHVTMSSYETMNRILKFYKFAFGNFFLIVAIVIGLCDAFECLYFKSFKLEHF